MDCINTNAGALPSNAGDDFHLLWAAQKLLKMLNHNSDLVSVTVEGPAWQDSIINDLDENKLFSIDLAEYYGGETIHSATLFLTVCGSHPSIFACLLSEILFFDGSCNFSSHATP